MAKNDDILTTAKERFQRALERSAHNRDKMREDIRFAAASPDDPWQWDKQDQIARKGRPMLTINKLPQHIRQVTNDIRQNRPSIRFRPANSEADAEVAEILMGLVRHIEANSDADVAYDTAAEHQVVHGLGYIRVLTDYVSEDSFDQDIYIKPVKDPFRVFDDPDVEDPAGADRRWMFIEERLSAEEFEAQYPDADAIDWTFTTSGEGWFSGDKQVRIVEYFERLEKPATLLMWRNGQTSYEGAPLPDGVMPGERPLKTRRTTQCKVMWRKMNGQEVLEERELAGEHIPFARVIGNEWCVDGKTYLSGLVRNTKDSQRMYNVAQSAIVERVLLSPKTPWIAPADAIEGYEKVWQSANTQSHAFLPYNHQDDSGNPIPGPTRMQPATIEPGLNQIAMGASDDIKSETGQYDASLGQRSNETSGRAIMARQREGDNATYHYVDNLARAVRHVGRIILGMMPEVYDTQRVARIIGEDDEQSNATIDPSQPQPINEYQDEMGEIQRIFNPNVGLYDVYTSTGPSYNTKRMEAVDAMTSMTQANPQLWQVIGDLLVKNMDWPGADDMAKRLKLTLLPEVQAEVDKEKGEPEIPPQMQQAMQQMQQQIEGMGQALNNASQQVDGLEAEIAKREAEIAKREQALMQEQVKRMKVEIDLQRTQAIGEVERAQQELVKQINAQEEVDEMPEAQVKADMEAQRLEFDRYRAQLEAKTKVMVAQISAGVQVADDFEPVGLFEPARPAEPVEQLPPEPDLTQVALLQALEGFTEAITELRRPKTIVRGPDGRALGIQ
jgi:hypothetical protein